MKKMTWGDCKLSALRTMFSNEGAAINIDDSNQDYVYAMAGKANEALQQLVSVGRPLLKQFSITVALGVDEEATESKLTLPAAEVLYKLQLEHYLPRFRCIDQLMLESGGVYDRAEEWSLEGDNVLVLPGNIAGTYTLWYAAYPQTITNDTPDTEILDVHPEAAVLIPLYIAAELYKEDELAMATMFRNEFEDGLEKLRQAYRESGNGFRGGVVRNTTGWW